MTQPILALGHISPASRVQLLTSKLIPMASPTGQHTWEVQYLMADQTALTLTWTSPTGLSRRNVDAELWNIMRWRYQRQRGKSDAQRIAIDDQFLAFLGQLQIPHHTHLAYYLGRLAQTTYAATANGVTGDKWRLGDYVRSRSADYFDINPLVTAVLDSAPDNAPSNLAFYTSLKSPRARHLYRILESLQPHTAATGTWQRSVPIGELITTLGIYTAQGEKYVSNPTTLAVPTWNVVQRVLSRSTAELQTRGYLTSTTYPGQYLERVAQFAGSQS